jgi:hypothetical protein
MTASHARIPHDAGLALTDERDSTPENLFLTVVIFSRSLPARKQEIAAG